MKKFLFAVVILIGIGASVCHAQDFPFQKSSYEYANVALSITSHTITNIAAVSGGYRQVTIPNTLTGATTFYYRLDASSTTIATIGIPVKPNEIATIESNKIIYLLREPGKAAATIRYQSKRK